MTTSNSIENQLWIAASPTAVERCLIEQSLMHQWLNPVLRCVPVDQWSVELGSQMRFEIQLPLLRPTLLSRVIERSPGLVVWGFEGFFEGRDRWQCRPEDKGTILLNRFEFSIPNPLVAWGFRTVAQDWTRRDMAAQLQRLKQVAEQL